MKIYSYDEIFQILTFIASVVDKYGDIYLPLFERVQMELEKAERRQNSIELAKKIATIGKS